jgi:ribonuclease P protein component
MSMKFPKKEKLKSKKLIEKLFKEGKTLSNFPLKLIYLKVDVPVDAKFKTGVAVPKKNFKSAVKRNRIKRLLREAYRLNKHLVFNNSEGNFAFLILYLGKEMPTYPEIEEGMQKILQKFLKKIDDAKVD